MLHGLRCCGYGGDGRGGDEGERAGLCGWCWGYGAGWVGDDVVEEGRKEVEESSAVTGA